MAADTTMEAATHHGSLIFDLGLVVVTASVVILIFRQLKLPVIFGYLLGGMLLGPNLLPVSMVQDLGSIQQLSELGVILLLFFIGMEFDLKRLKQVLGPALMALILQTFAMIQLARLFGPMLGWDSTSSLFFGSLLAISSSMVTINILREQGRMHLPHAQLAVGILILEDVLAVILLVVLTGVAVTREFQWGAIWLVTFLMGIFVVVVFIFGRIFAQRISQLLAKWDSAEAITIFSMGFLMAVSLLAHQFEFSVALGAFLAGAIFSQTPLTHRIEQTNRSLHDLFSAVFFVTIGMLIDPFEIITNWYWIALFALCVVAGKISSCWLGLFLSGQHPRSAYRGAVAKSQIGEFSFIIAELGRQLQVTDGRLSSIAFGVAFLTIMATPFVSSGSEAQYKKLERMMPAALKSFAGFYRNFIESLGAVLGRSVLLKLLQRPLLQILLYFFVMNGIILGASLAADKIVSEGMFAGFPAASLIWLLAAAMMTPFLIALVRNLNAIVIMLTVAMFAGSASRPIMQGRMRNLFNALILALVLVLMGGLFLAAAADYLPRGVALGLFTLLLILMAVVFWRKMVRFNSHLEWLFMKSFTEEVHKAEQSRRESTLDEITAKYPWEVRLCEHVIKPGSAVLGRRIRELNLRAETGTLILALGRNGHQIFDPSPQTPLFPGDNLILLGEEEQTTKAVQKLDAPSTDEEPQRVATRFRIDKILLPTASSLDGNTLAGAELRKRYGVTVVGIQRGSERITSPSADAIMRAGDVLMVVGAPERLEEFKNYVDTSALTHEAEQPA